MSNVREQYIVDEKGTRTAVILSLKDYQRLLEDLHDLAIVAERHDEPTCSQLNQGRAATTPVVSELKESTWREQRQSWSSKET